MTTDPHPDHDPPNTPPQPRPRRGLRLYQILAAVAVIALLLIMLLPATRSSRSAARRAQCTNNLKQIGLALNHYAQQYGTLPPLYTTDLEGRPLHSWRTLILPFIEEQTLYETIDLAKPWNDPANAAILKKCPPGFRCPESHGPPNTTTYLAIVAPDSAWNASTPRRLEEITDGMLNTLLVIEAGEENAVPWMSPTDAGESVVMSFGPSTKLHHAGGTNAAFADGSVHFLKNSTSATNRRAIITIAGDEPFDQETFSY